MNRLILVSLLVASICAVPIVQLRKLTTEEDTLFEKFKQQHSKVYFDQHDESYRKQIFVDNLKAIRQHNAEAATGAHTFTLAMNKFGDMTLEEFHTKYTGFLGLRHRFARSQNLATHVEARATVDSVDWTTKGAVTAVKNQGQCGSCWSFSTTGSVEGAWFLAKGALVSLSEQQLMDCSKSEGNNSCEGGLMDYAFEYIIKNGGLGSEASYPYKAVDENTCKSVPSVASISSYKDVDQTEAALQAAVTQQPVSVAIEADQLAFQFYKSGVLTGRCGTTLDHGVLAVGFGTLDNTPYWKVKNSWGADWGMDGYVLLEKGKDQKGGQCGILLAASYPVV